MVDVGWSIDYDLVLVCCLSNARKGSIHGRLYIKSDSPSLYEWSEVRGQRLSDELMVNGASKC